MSFHRRPLTSVPVQLTGEEGPESFASFIERLAAHQLVPVPVTTILKATGLISEDRFDAVPTGYGIDLTPEQLTAVARACHLEVPDVTAMLMCQFDGLTSNLADMDVTDVNSVRAVAQREWAGFSGSVCCPACLREDAGGWRIRWKVWTSFACLRHQRLLLDQCPRCERRTGSYRADQGNRPRFATHPPAPGRCANSLSVGAAGVGRAARPCGQDLMDLATLDLSGAPRLLRAQRQINEVLETRTALVAGRPVPGLTYFGHLRSLVTLALHVAAPEDLGALPVPIRAALEAYVSQREAIRASERGRKGTSLHPYKAQPGDTQLLAATLPWATELLAQLGHEQLTEALRPMIERARVVRSSHVRQVAVDFHMEGALGAALSRILAFRAPLRHTIGHQAPGGTGSYRTFRTEAVPHLIWVPDYERDFRPLIRDSGVGETAARVAISMALVMLTGPQTRDSAIRALGLEGLHKGTSLNVLITHLKSKGNAEAFQEALHGLATRLERPGRHRDYRAAQAALSGFTTLDMKTWEQCQREAGLPSIRSEAVRRNVAAWIWATAMSSHPYFSPALSAGAANQESLREMYRRFEARQLPDLLPCLMPLASNLEEALVPAAITS